MNLQRQKQTIASFVMGCVGAGIGGGWSYYALCREPTAHAEFFTFEFVTFAVGLISGFLSCFLVSKWYLNFMEGKTWQRGILFGPLFGALAGAISGATTGLTCGPGFAFFGVFEGGFIGLVIGAVFWLIFGRIVLGFLKKRE